MVPRTVAGLAPTAESMAVARCWERAPTAKAAPASSPVSTSARVPRNRMEA